MSIFTLVLSIVFSCLLLFSGEDRKFQIVEVQKPTVFSIVSIEKKKADTPPKKEEKIVVDGDIGTGRNSDFYVVMFTATWCGPCQNYKISSEYQKVDKKFKITQIDIDLHPEWKRQVSSYPTFWLCRRNGQTKVAVLSTGWLSLSTVERAVKTATTPTSLNARSRERLPVVSTQWGTIDLETYATDCNCDMCNGIRDLQAEWTERLTRAANQVEPSAPPESSNFGQDPTPSSVMKDSLALLSLVESDVLVDFGCGDGRVLIEASKEYGCSGVGVEIDAEMAKTAVLKVKEAGLENKIEIVEGDVVDFDLEKYQVSAWYAYLYPETLEKLVPLFKKIGRGTSPYHRVSGIEMAKIGDVWIQSP